MFIFIIYTINRTAFKNKQKKRGIALHYVQKFPQKFCKLKEIRENS